MWLRLTRMPPGAEYGVWDGILIGHRNQLSPDLSFFLHNLVLIIAQI